MINIEQKIIDYKKEKESMSLINQVNETFWTDIKNPLNDKKENPFDKWAELYLKEKKTIWQTAKMSFLELRLSIFDKDFKSFKEELDNLKEWIINNSNNTDSPNSQQKTDSKDTKTDSDIELDNIQKKVVDIAKENTGKSNVAEIINDSNKIHCRWWAEAIYKKAWLLEWDRKIIYQDWKYYSSIWEQLSNNDLINIIKPGDWIYVHNWNSIDQNWDHSVIFLWRENNVIWQANTASYPWSGNEAVIKTYDLATNPIRHISRASSIA